MDTYVRETADGGVDFGVIVEGAYVPLAKLTGDRVTSLVENAVNRGDVVESKTTSGKGSKGKSGGSEAGEEG